MPLFAIFLIVALLLGTPVYARSDTPPPSAQTARQCVILIHGLARTYRSLSRLEQVLREEGYAVVNLDYPSREQTIESLSQTYIPQGLQHCRTAGAERIHFVTHSMGGIMVRYFLENNQVTELGRTVMLSPPNRGSEVVDKMGEMPGFYALNGPAGMQLGTGPESLPNRLGAVDYPVGVITGNRSINLILSLLIPGPDDGKVAVKRAGVEGMKDFMVVPHTHPLIMNSDEVIRQVMHFLKRGEFDHSGDDT